MIRPTPPQLGSRVRLSPIATAILALVAFGCAPDNRIDVATLQDMEKVADESRPAEPMPAAGNLRDFQPYRVAIGDVLAVQIIGSIEGQSDRTVRLRVSPDGRIVLPTAGPVEVAGLTLSEVESRIYQTYVPKYLKDLSIYAEVSQPENTTVLVFGNGLQHSLVSLPKNERNVLSALAAAGSVSLEDTERVRVRPIRPDRPELVFNLNNPDDVRRVLSAPPLDSGDLIFIESAEQSAIVMMGLVNQQGPIPIPRSSTLSLQRAVATAGGFREDLNVKEATLVRSLSDGRRVRVKLNVDKILAGDEPELALRAGDIIEFPHTLDTIAQQWFARNILVGPFQMTVQYDPLEQYNANRALSGPNVGLKGAIRSSIGSSIPGILIPPPQP